MAQDHGGNLGQACDRFGGAPGDWLDLSTGINPSAYPVGGLDPADWTRLPGAGALDALLAAARTAYGVPDAAHIVAAPGCSALIAALPPPGGGTVAIAGPTYGEHAAAFAHRGWRVVDRPGPGVGAVVIVTPNNPDGRRWHRDELALLAQAVPLLVVDESFIDPWPDRSAAPLAGGDSLVILRSFGKFYGLGGLRLGFALCGPRIAARLTGDLGPWAVSGPALTLGARALADTGWQAATAVRVVADGARLAALGRGAGWRVVADVGLFVTFEVGDAAAAQARLARARIWSRIFDHSPTWLRLGLPGPGQWDRLTAALA